VKYASNVCELIGNTPLVRISLLAEGLLPLVLAKAEFFNPGGSAKDRIAQRMIHAAEEAGLLCPGGTIVEPTSGNTGVGLAMVGRRRGYRCIFVCPDKVSESKRDVLRAYGAEVVVCPTSVPPEDKDSYYSVSDRLAREIPGAWKPDQYSNPENPASHYATTGPEIWEQTEGRVTHFIAGVGTGGTITGVGTYLKDASDGRVRVIGADPEGSVYSGGCGRPYLVEGVGEDFWPRAFDKDICDEIIRVSDAESFQTARYLTQKEGLLVGGSGGLATAAALKVARRCGPDDVVVVLLPDGGRGYLSKIYNDDWMSAHGFLPPRQETSSVRDLLTGKASALSQVIHVHREQSITQAVTILRTHGVSQAPVASTPSPSLAGEIVGSISERRLLEALASGQASPHDQVQHHMLKPLPTIGANEAISTAITVFDSSDALLVLDVGKLVGVITRQDVLGQLCGN
jgi:cystathionine beta-synthase